MRSNSGHPKRAKQFNYFSSKGKKNDVKFPVVDSLLWEGGRDGQKALATGVNNRCAEAQKTEDRARRGGTGGGLHSSARSSSATVGHTTVMARVAPSFGSNNKGDGRALHGGWKKRACRRGAE